MVDLYFTFSIDVMIWKNKVEAKIQTGNDITAKITYRNICAIIVVMATLYGCFTIRMKDLPLLSAYPVQTSQTKSTAVQDNSSNINSYQKYSNAASRTTNENKTRIPNTFVKIDKALTLEDTEGHNWRKDSVLTYKKIVLIVAYMRTGSTLTGSLFQRYPGTFYLFEPIRFLTWEFDGLTYNNKKYFTLEYVNGTKRNYSASEKNKVILDELNNWLLCKFESISIRSLTSIQHRRYTKAMDTFYDCFNGNLGSYITHAGENSKSCLKQAINSCEKASIRATKEIRLSVEDATKLLPLYPNMKIIHLVRDPRGILNSRFKIHEVGKTSFKDDIEKHCKTVEKDLKFSKEILHKYPNRLKIVQYEDLAERPIETARALFDFVELPFDKSMQNFIQEQTNASIDAGAYATQRKDSSRTANKWRLDMDSETARFIFDMCKTSNSVLGYLPLTTDQALRNEKLPSRQLLDAA